MVLGFIISTSVREEKHLVCLDETIKHIKNYYPKNKIILIDDGIDSYDITKIYSDDDTINVIKTKIKGTGEHIKYKFFKETDFFDTAVMLCDKSFLQKKIENAEKMDIKFISHFSNHRFHWDTIKEPQTDYNIKHNIISHTDLIRHTILKDYTQNKDFQKFALEKLIKKNEWVGMLGANSIISKKTMIDMDNKVNFIETFSKVNTNRDRRAIESILALICHYCYPNIDFSKSLDGLYYDGTPNSIPDGRGKDSGVLGLKWFVKKEHFGHIQFDRNDFKV